jgi:hypothetical protein
MTRELIVTEDAGHSVVYFGITKPPDVVRTVTLDPYTQVDFGPGGLVVGVRYEGARFLGTVMARSTGARITALSGPSAAEIVQQQRQRSPGGWLAPSDLDPID